MGNRSQDICSRTLKVRCLTKMNNRGSAVVEAVIVVPLFIFAVLSFYLLGKGIQTQLVVYEAGAQVCEYMAEYAYNDISNPMLPYTKLREYLDDEELVEKYVKDGVDGISFLGTVPIDSDNRTLVRMTYSICISLPFVPDYEKRTSFVIVQRAYKGILPEEYDGGDEYVYVTDNRDVYHLTRSCTHLRLKIIETTHSTARQQGLSLCGFCKDTVEEGVYITESGKKWHKTSECAGLTRNIYRVKKETVSELPLCSRCEKKAGR